jgi:hypothetical protein
MYRKQYSRVCLTHNAYALLTYLLYSSEEEINDTFFFFATGVDKSIRINFPGQHHFFPHIKRNGNEIIKLLYHIYIYIFIWLMRKTRWAFLKDALFFAHDYYTIDEYIIGKNNYTLLEDAPYCYELLIPRIKKPSKGMFGSYHNKRKTRALGNNKQCNAVIISDNEILPYMKQKEIIAISLHSLWEKSSALKKQLILDAFNVTGSDIDLIKSKENILFTQTFIEDHSITLEEHNRIYNKIIDNYDRNTLLIKEHPREKFDYKQLFPDIPSFEKPVPMQLFNLLGVRFKRAITVMSSVVASFDYDIEIDWYGTEISEDLANKMGALKCPPTIFQKKKMQDNIRGKQDGI